jgi:hypothetical protein
LVAFTVAVCAPSLSGVVATHEKRPMVSAVVVQTTLPSTDTSTDEPGSARPVKVGVWVETVLPAAGCCSTGVLGAAATVNGVGVLVIERFPAGSVALAVTECMPGASGRVTGQLHVPSAVATTSQITWPSMRTVTVLPASAVPVMVGVGPVVWPAVGPVMTGGSGAMVSMVKGTVCELALVPPEEVAVAVTWCGPSASGVAGEQMKRPVSSATAVQTGIEPPSTYSLTVAPGVARPSKAGVGSVPELLATGAVMTGVEGGWPVATVKGVGAVNGEVLPARSAAEAVTVCAPMLNGVGEVQVHSPAAFAMAVQTGVVPPSTKTLTVALGSLVPAYTGMLLVVALAAGAVMTGATGAVVSTVKGVIADGALVPAVVVAVAATVCGPSASAGLTSQRHSPVDDAVVMHAGVLLPSM